MAYDWRTGPDPRPCAACTATLAGCENKRGFSGRACCDACDHDHDIEPVAA